MVIKYIKVIKNIVKKKNEWTNIGLSRWSTTENELKRREGRVGIVELVRSIPYDLVPKLFYCYFFNQFSREYNDDTCPFSLYLFMYIINSQSAVPSLLFFQYCAKSMMCQLTMKINCIFFFFGYKFYFYFLIM